MSTPPSNTVGAQSLVCLNLILSNCQVGSRCTTRHNCEMLNFLPEGVPEEIRKMICPGHQNHKHSGLISSSMHAGMGKQTSTNHVLYIELYWNHLNSLSFSYFILHHIYIRIITYLSIYILYHILQTNRCDLCGFHMHGGFVLYVWVPSRLRHQPTW